MKSVKLKKSMMAVAFAGMTVAAFGAQAAILNTWLIPGENEIQDTDVERILDSSGAVKTDGDFAVGDVIQTILFWDTVNGLPFSIIDPPPPSGYQLTTYAELEVFSISDNLIDGAGGLYDIVFAPTGNLSTATSFADVYECTVAATCGYNPTLDPATAIARVTSGTLIASFGLGEADDFWAVTTLLDIGIAAALEQGDPQVSNGVFGLSVVSNPGGLPIATNGIEGADGNLHDVVGNASAYQLAPTSNAGWLVSSNTSASFNVVPEPATVALMGMGLLGMGLGLRRRKA